MAYYLCIGLVLLIFQTPTCTAGTKYFEYIFDIIVTFNKRKTHYNHHEFISKPSNKRVLPNEVQVLQHIADNLQKTRPEATFEFRKHPKTDKMRSPKLHRISEDSFKDKQHYTEFICFLNANNEHFKHCPLARSESENASL